MRKLLLVAISFTFFLRDSGYEAIAFAQGADEESATEESADIRKQLEAAAEEESVHGASKPQKPSGLPDIILKRGYVEGKLLRAQDSLIQDIETGKKRTGATMVAFLGIHAALLSKWGLAVVPDDPDRIVNHFFPIVKDKNYSWYLRAHYLKRADDFRRGHRGEKTSSFRDYTKKHLALAKDIEADEDDSAEMRAEALKVILGLEMDDAKRRRLILRHCRSKSEALRRAALFDAVRPANLSEEILEDILDQYEKQDSEPEAIRKELRFALINIGRFAKTPKYQEYKGKAILRLEQLKQRRNNTRSQEDIDDLIDDMTRDPKEPKKNRGRSQKK